MCSSDLPMGQPILRVPLGVQPSRLERPLQVVEDGHNVPEELALPASRRRLHLGAHPLAVVVEVGLCPLREFEVLVPLALGVRQQSVQVLFDLDLRLLLDPSLRRLLLAHLSSPSSTTSASTTSSSSAEEPPSVEAPSLEAACSAWAAS